MSLTPLSLQNYDFSNPLQAKQYQYQLMQFLNGLLAQFNTAQSQIAALNTQVAALNTQVAALNTFVLTPNSAQLGSIAVNTTLNCQGSYLSVVTFTMTAALTMTFSNLPLGAYVLFGVTVGATARLLKLAASTPAPVTYTGIGMNYAGSPGAPINMLATGLSIGGGTIWAIGASYGTAAAPLLNFIAS